MVEMACTTDILDFDRGAIETVPIRSYKGGWIVLNFVMHMYFEVHIDLKARHFIILTIVVTSKKIKKNNQQVESNGR